MTQGHDDRRPGWENTLPRPGKYRGRLLGALRTNLWILQRLAERLEQGRPPQLAKSEPILTPADAVKLLAEEMEPLEQEQFRVILLTTKNTVIDTVLLYQGNIHTIQIRAAEVFREAVRRNAYSIIVVHNHPSGQASPSRDDLAITRQLEKAGDLLGIALLDHIIIGKGTYASLREKGMMREVGSGKKK